MQAQDMNKGDVAHLYYAIKTEASAITAVQLAVVFKESGSRAVRIEYQDSSSTDGGKKLILSRGMLPRWGWILLINVCS
jgi:hypothetical protein